MNLVVTFFLTGSWAVVHLGNLPPECFLFLAIDAPCAKRCRSRVDQWTRPCTVRIGCHWRSVAACRVRVRSSAMSDHHCITSAFLAAERCVFRCIRSAAATMALPQDAALRPPSYWLCDQSLAYTLARISAPTLVMAQTHQRTDLHGRGYDEDEQA